MTDAPRLAIIAGAGLLPEMLANQCRATGQAYVVVTFPTVPLPWAGAHPTLAARFEHLGAMFQKLHDHHCAKAVFAGAMTRPHLDLTQLDDTSRRLVAALGAGDDTTLRASARLFAENGLDVVAPQAILPDLQCDPGVMGRIAPGAADLADIARAAAIVTALGRVDVGQGAVVAQGLCLGLESLQGTDVMLDFVARTAENLRPDPNGARGVLYKACKPDQDARLDLPAIGPDTVAAARAAGLAGIALEAGQVMILNRAETLAAADRAGLFVFGYQVP